MTRVLLGAAALFLLISLSFWLFASWWWANLFFAVLIGFAMQLGAGPSFLAGAGSSFLSWFISMYWINAGNGGLLLQKMRAVLGLPFGSDTGVMLFIALLGALLGGLGFLLGQLGRDIATGPVDSRSKRRRRGRKRSAATFKL
ncbi:hypothetical protein [Saprospira grandis]|uniref:hypothetical protein n=1 Tax=Saprospira grandis TaxID=1008 RepID=UPI0022DCF621|nr:hypothetical protein [Saprospira grandis]WBM73402.1 hypothetical protein OP864_10370 [Saprospira grandis]